MNFLMGWLLGRLSRPNPASTREEPEHDDLPPPTLTHVAFLPFTFAARFLSSFVVLAVMLCLIGIYVWSVILMGQWVMDAMEPFAKANAWGPGERALFVVGPGLVVMGLCWTIPVFVVGTLWRGVHARRQQRDATRQVQDVLRKAKKEAARARR